MNDLTQKLIVALVIVPTLFGIFQRPKEMAISVVAIALAASFANLDKLTRFKGAGFEAEMRTAIDKTYAAVDDLKDLGVSLSKPIVDDLAVSGQVFRYIPLQSKLERLEEIQAALRKLGASEKEIDEVWSTMSYRLTWDHIHRVLYALRQANPDKAKIFEGLDDWKADDWSFDKLNQFIDKNELKQDEDTKEMIADLKFFLKNRKLRRPDKWQG